MHLENAEAMHALKKMQAFQLLVPMRTHCFRVSSLPVQADAAVDSTGITRQDSHSEQTDDNGCIQQKFLQIRDISFVSLGLHPCFCTA